ncbi:MAG: hypothetical protein AAFR39_08990 [Pseudomonadota bacterium]
MHLISLFADFIGIATGGYVVYAGLRQWRLAKSKETDGEEKNHKNEDGRGRPGSSRSSDNPDQSE